MRKLTLAPSVLVLAAALAVVGCGERDEATLSKAEFIERADTICQRADDTEIGEFGAYVFAHPKVRKKLKETTGTEQPDQIAAREEVVRAVLFPSILRVAQDIEALGPPAGDEKTIEKFLAGIREAIEEAKKDPSRAEENLPNGTGKNPEYAFSEVNKLAREYGFKQCNEVV